MVVGLVLVDLENDGCECVSTKENFLVVRDLAEVGSIDEVCRKRNDYCAAVKVAFREFEGHRRDN